MCSSLLCRLPLLSTNKQLVHLLLFLFPAKIRKVFYHMHLLLFYYLSRGVSENQLCTFFTNRANILICAWSPVGVVLDKGLLPLCDVGVDVGLAGRAVAPLPVLLRVHHQHRRYKN